MAVGKHKDAHQADLWVATQDLPRVASHPFYRKLNEVLKAAGFDRKVEELAKPFYAEKMGRPSLPPGVYVRMLLVGYFEGIDSERGIAWRCADSLAIREFLGYQLTEKTPDHSTVSGTRRRLPVEWHQEVFALVSSILVERGLIKGNTIAMDASTMEANAAMRSIVRRDTKEPYGDFVKGLAEDSGVETPTAAELKQFDRTRKKKTASNKDWESPTDRDAKIMRMKDGRTRLGYKAEHAVDLETEAIVSAEIQPGDQGDTKTGPETLECTQFSLTRIKEHIMTFEATRSEVITDKGYFKSEWLSDLALNGYRTYFAEPAIPRRRWKSKNGTITQKKAAERDAVYANRRRIRGPPVSA